VHGKNFVEMLKNLARYKSKNNFIKSNFSSIFLRKTLKFARMSKFCQKAICLNVLLKNFFLIIKLFSDLYLAKFFNISIKSFFSCVFYLNLKKNILNCENILNGESTFLNI